MATKKTVKTTPPAAPAVAKSETPAKKKTMPKSAAVEKMKPIAPVEPKAEPKVAANKSKATQPTVITAQIDVGFGNTLYIRGDGPGLSWEKGVALDCVADDQWSISINNAAKTVTFKFLLNDITWCTGDDYSVAPGTTFAITPAF